MTGHIVQRGKKFTVVIDSTANGKRKQRWHSGFESRQAAKDAIPRLLYETQEGLMPDKSNITVGQWLDKWLKEYCLHLSPTTRRGYLSVIACLQDPLDGWLLQELSTSAVQGCVLRWQDEHVAPGTIRQRIAVLSAALSKAVDLDLIRKNPCKVLSLPRKNTQEAKVLSEQECRRLLDKARSTDIYLPILLALTTGMRRGEICALEWSDIDLERGIVVVSHNCVETPDGLEYKDTKSGKVRSILLPGFVVGELLAYRESEKVRHLRGGMLYCGYPSYLSTRFARFAKEYGFKVTFHGLRHTHATLLLERGVNMKVTQERMGHSTVGMTLDTYSHTTGQMQGTASTAIEEALG